VLSLFVHVTTSPTLAVMGWGLNAKPLMVAATVPVSVDASHPPAAAPVLADAAVLSDAAALSEAAADSLAAVGPTDGAVVAVPLFEQAATMSSRAAVAAARWNVRDISISSCVRIRVRPPIACRRYAAGVATVS
jgi:hypothetical protein